MQPILRRTAARASNYVGPTPWRKVAVPAALAGLALAGAAGLVGALQPKGTDSGPAASVVSQGPPSTLAAMTPKAVAGSELRASVQHGSLYAAEAGLPALGVGAGPTGPSEGSLSESQVSSPLIEETGALTVLVPARQIEADVGSLMGLATGSGGFVASTSTQSAEPGSPAQAMVTLQVPVASFGNVVDQVKSLGKVASEETSATDVTGQYVDLQARITALEDSRSQYLTIMTKATTIGGILAVQSQLDNLQSQLDQLQSQLKTVTNETTYASLVVTLAQSVVAPPPPRPEPGLLRAWRGAVSGFVAGFEGLVRVAGPLFFALLLLAALVMAGRLAWRSAHRPTPAKEPDGAQVAP
ncbi:MAG TPA: DUF4349 domain-containing protein [Acidimicrobiales bacterium]|nr:DUF4349 domain-containing protein [Acidimicrobiales bacterium]